MEFEEMILKQLEGSKTKAISAQLVNKLISSHARLSRAYLYSTVNRYTCDLQDKYDNYVYEGKAQGTSRANVLFTLRKFHNSGKGLIAFVDLNNFSEVQNAFREAATECPDMPDSKWNLWEERLEKAEKN